MMMRDTSRIATSRQVQLNLLRYCCNTVPNYWLRTMPPSVTAAAVTAHDAYIATAAAAVFDFDPASPCGALATQQLRLPTRMGGLGLTELAPIAPAAFVGSLAAGLATIHRLIPSLSNLDPARLPTDALPHLPTIAALRTSHSALISEHKALESEQLTWDSTPVRRPRHRR